MPTPASSWGGVNLFWPMDSYIGGFGNVCWWNNNDIFLIAVSVIVLNLIILFLSRYIRYSKVFTLIVFLLGFILSIYQIKSREVDFSSGNSKNYQDFELQSKEIQKELLGEIIYDLMIKFDSKLRIYF
jgi:hypothetical protein